MRKAFKKYQEFFILALFALLIFSFNLGLEFLKFQAFKEDKHQSFNELKVLQSYLKTNEKGRTYRVLKLESENFSFYTTTNKEIPKHSVIFARVITSGVSFKDFLSKSFYMPSYDLQILSKEPNFKHSVVPYFLNQHSDEKVREFYGALFFAIPVSKELRNDVNFYGIAHLIAISGYHIALLFSLCFFLLMPLYSFFQKRFFPYRNARLDISLIIFVFLFFYAYLIGFVPSFVRSLVMVLWGFYLLSKNARLISFANLFFSVLICLALFPQLLFSIGFLFSVCGVFFIFLYIHHFAKFFSNFINVILLNLWTFLAMIIPVLCFFPLISFQQFLAVPLSALFVAFYPVVLCLHFLGFGGLFDALLLEFFSIKFAYKELPLNFWALLFYLFLALVSLKFKYLALFCVLLNLLCFGILFV